MTRFALILAAAAMTAALTPLPAAAQGARAELGVLDCDVSGGIGFLIGSQREVNCMFAPAGGGPEEHYVGAIRKFGLDIGATTGGQMVWVVHAETSARRDALAGTYVGASAEATIAVGLGANVLVGGSNRTIALQPVSVQAQTGLNVAAGVTELELVPARRGR
jgi:hypothetical protein